MPPSTLRRCLLLSFAFHIVCRAAWVTKFRCSSSQSGGPSDGPFWIDSLHGALDASDVSSVLSLSLLGVHNASEFTCNDLDLTDLETGLQFYVLGLPVGRVDSFRSQCPLPVTQSLTPPEGLLFSEYELIYTLAHPHRLQTLYIELSIKDHQGAELDCAAVKVTPDIGTTTSAALTYIPAGVMALVGIASWQRHIYKPGRCSSFEYSDTWAGHIAVREIVLELAEYLRYLQFIFLAGSLSIEYPGFFQPIVGQVSWSSLLYWRGPINNGFTYPGVEDGIYANNASYGLEHMAQVLGFPQVPNIMLDVFINLIILAAAITVILLAFCLMTYRPSQPSLPSLTIRQGGWILLNVTLAFFSLPLLSYMSYDLILIGYLPNYRVTFVSGLIAVLICLNYLNTRHHEKEREQADASSTAVPQEGDRPTGPRELLARFTFLPHAIPLLQGIMIGGLQNWGLAQILVLGACELIVLLHMILRPHTRLCLSTIWCTSVRLLTLSLSIAFTCQSSEAVRQWAGYLTLCLHAVTVLFCFFIKSACQFFRAAWKRVDGTRLWSPSRRGRVYALEVLAPSDLSPGSRNGDAAYGSRNNSNKNDSPSSSGYPGAFETSYRGFNHINSAPTPSPWAPPDMNHHIAGYSAFYRPPRPRVRNQVVEPNAASLQSEPITSPRGSVGELFHDSDVARRSQNTLHELLEVPGQSDVDYSVRESDFYYGRPTSDLVRPPTPGLLTEPQTEQSEGNFREWTHRAVARLKGSRSTEKGFQVVRPRRPV